MAGGGGGVVGGLLMKVFVGMLMVVGVVVGAQLPAEEVHHVVGGQVGWHPQVNLASWSSGRLFTVGDKLWFSYSPAHESVVELQTLEEYLSCDLTNPIRMYTDGMSKVPLEEVKIRYFASGSLESCKNGLKLHMEVLPAIGPTPSKASTIINGLSLMSLIGLSICILG
jgi:hypothetical protein